MRGEQIPDFVGRIIKAGCDIRAIGRETYVICDFALPDELANLVSEICSVFGEREHLRLEITAHLRGIGRFVDIADQTMH